MNSKTILGLIIVAVAAVSSSFAQELKITTTAANTVASKTTIDLPGLTGNPQAIIVAIPIDNTATLNPHPIGAWYYNGKWNIFNSDHAVMPIGMRFAVQAFPVPGPNQFLHVASKANITQGVTVIDNPILNGNPGAEVRILQNHAPEQRAYNLSPNNALATYNPAAGKWQIANTNGKPLSPNTAFNVVISSNGSGATTASPPPGTTSATPPGTTNADETASKPDPVRPASQAGVFSVQDLDLAASSLAREIARSDDRSLPALYTALQKAGFYVLDAKGSVLMSPESGKGQGLGFYDFEAIGSLKLDKRGISLSLEKLAASITRETPQIPAQALAEALLTDIRKRADSTENADLRFWARLIIELGKSSSARVDLMTAQTSEVTLSVLQATLLLRRLQGDVFSLRSRRGQTGVNRRMASAESIFVAASWPSVLTFRPEPASLIASGTPCNLTGDQALILDAGAVGLTTGQGAVMELLSRTIPSLGSIANAVGVANIVLAWGKLVASYTTMKSELTVEKPLPLKRTKNSVPGEKRLLTARFWNEVGNLEVLNCLRPAVNIATGLDFNLPTDGPLGDVAVEWEFDGENKTALASKKFVFFQPMPGADPKPNNQVTDENGVSKMDLVGSPKVPAYAYFRNPMTVSKHAQVLVAVRLKSSKDVVQNWIDIGGTIIGVMTGGPLGLIGSAAEIGYRMPVVMARTTVPVTDYEECDGRWFTVEYRVTLKGQGHRAAGRDGTPEVNWSFDRSYESNFGLFDRSLNLTPAEVANLALVQEAIKAERKFVYSHSRDPIAHIEIDDKVETITKDVCADKTNETTTDIETWKANGDFPTFKAEKLFTDRILHTYNVWLPIGSSDRLAKARYFRQRFKGRSGGIRPSVAGTNSVDKLVDLFTLPDVAGFIKGGLITHDPDKEIPQSFPQEWEFDSGDLMPDKPLIANIPETRTEVKIRFYYRFIFGCR